MRNTFLRSRVFRIDGTGMKVAQGVELAHLDSSKLIVTRGRIFVNFISCFSEF